MIPSRRDSLRRLASLAAGGWLMSDDRSAARDEFASDRPEPILPAPFDAVRAMGYLEAICAIGPRISGTDGMLKQQQLLTRHFNDCGAVVTLQKFTARQRSKPEPVEMANLIAR